MSNTISYSSVPSQLIGTFFPSQNASILDLIAFDLHPLASARLTASSIQYSYKKADDLSVSDSLLRSLVPPTVIDLNALTAPSIEPAPEVQSVEYRFKTKLVTLPVSVLPVWQVLIELHQARRAWIHAATFMERESARSADHASLVDRITLKLAATTTSIFASKHWLNDLNIAQVQDTIQRKMSSDSSLIHRRIRLVDVFFSKKLEDGWLDEELGTEIAKSSRKWLARVGEELVSGVRDILVGVVHLGGNHWIAYSVNFRTSTILFGDPQGKSIPPNTISSFQWWTSQQASTSFSVGKLAISRQSDDFSCGILSLNAMAHAINPETFPLLKPTALGISLARLQYLDDILSQHLAFVPPTNGIDSAPTRVSPPIPTPSQSHLTALEQFPENTSTFLGRSVPSSVASATSTESATTIDLLVDRPSWSVWEPSGGCMCWSGSGNCDFHPWVPAIPRLERNIPSHSSPPPLQSFDDFGAGAGRYYPPSFLSHLPLPSPTSGPNVPSKRPAPAIPMAASKKPRTSMTTSAPNTLLHYMLTDPTEIAMHEARRRERAEQEAEALREADEERSARDNATRREKERMKKQRYRAAKVQRQMESGERGSDGKPIRKPKDITTLSFPSRRQSMPVQLMNTGDVNHPFLVDNTVEAEPVDHSHSSSSSPFPSHSRNHSSSGTHLADISNTNSSPPSPAMSFFEQSALQSLPYKTTLAELSRPKRSLKAASIPSQIPEAKLAKYVNWKSPLLWCEIDAVARQHQFKNPTSIVRVLKSCHPAWFETLTPQVVGRWIGAQASGELGWKANVMDRVEEGYNPLGMITKFPILHRFPNVLEAFIQRVQFLRSAGLPVDTSSARAFLIGYIQETHPELFLEPWRDQTFRCSVSFVRKLFREHLGWSQRASTRAAQKLPLDAEAQCAAARLRIAYLIKHYDIPAGLIVNIDQTQCVLAMSNASTWAPKGDKQVAIVGKEEKRAITLTFGLCANGEALPVQAIFQGKTEASLPRETGPFPSLHLAECKAAGFIFDVSGTTNYWAGQDTMKSIVNNIIQTHFKRIMEKEGLPSDHHCILLLDVWAVHRSEEFRNWMKENHPRIHLVYVPAGCTGIFQPCDTNGQRTSKHAIRRAQIEDAIEETMDQVKRGVAAVDVKITTSMPILRNRTPRWLLRAHQALTPAIVLKAFELCHLSDPTLNLSYESLTSTNTRRALLNLATTHPTLHRDLVSVHAQAHPSDYINPTVPDLPTDIVEDSADLVVVDDDLLRDDDDVPTSAVAAHVLGDEIDDPLVVIGSTGSFLEGVDVGAMTDEGDLSDADEDFVPTTRPVPTTGPARRSGRIPKPNRAFWNTI